MVIDSESTEYSSNAFLIQSKKAIPTDITRKNNGTDRVMDLVKQNEYSITCLESIQSQINKIKDAKKSLGAKHEMVVENSSDLPMDCSPQYESLIQVVKCSTKQNLEKNMNSALNR